MNYKPYQLENFCKKPSPEIKCIVLFGTNEGEIATLQKKCAEAVCESVNDGFRYCVLNMEDVSKDGGEIYAEFHAQSLMGGRRVVVVKDADNSLTPLLKNMIPETGSDNLLILTSDSLNTKSSLITWGKERSDVILVGCYEEREGDISAQAEKMLREKGLSADVSTLQFLASRLSPDSKLNQSEIDKLEIYLGERKTVTTDDIKNVVSDVVGADFEDLCYYVADGETAKACDTYSRLLKEGNEVATVIRYLEYHFLRLLNCVAKIEEGKNIEEILHTFRPPLMFYRKTSFLKQLRIWNKERLLSALSLFYQSERNCKTTNMMAEQDTGQMILRLSSAVKKFR